MSGIHWMKKDLGWDEDTQQKIANVIRATRESMKHTIFGMMTRVKDGQKFIDVIDRHNNSGVARSKDLGTTRDLQVKLYDKLIRHYDLPYCCLMHKNEFNGDAFEFIDPDEDEFSFIDEDDFEFVTDDKDDFEFVDPNEDEDEGFDLADPDEDAWDEADPDDDGFDLD